jgi:SPP1 gp7 family putative phage head morphogenesis protein
MPITSETYWLDRAEKAVKDLDNTSDAYLKKLKGSYQRTVTSIDKDIQSFWAKYQGKTGLTYTQASQALDLATKKMLQEDAKSIADKIVRGDASIKQDLINFSKKNQLTRLEGLQTQINMELSRLANIQQMGMTDILSEALQTQYLQNRFTIDKGLGYGKTFNMLPKSKIDAILKKQWVGGNFSQRVWENTKKLADIAQQEITQGIIRGDSTQKMSRVIRDKMGNSYSASERLVRTEMTNIATEADMLAYEDSDIEKYEYVATLDNRTSEVCGELDGVVFDVKDKQVGVNAPPLHPNCRSTTIAVIGSKENQQRRARDAEGNSILVPANTTYTEWKKAVGL